jgi:NADPH2:quinone reductase
LFVCFCRFYRLQIIINTFIDGVIKEVGEVVSSGLKKGDEIYGQAGVTICGSGAFAELALANENSIAHKPTSLSHVEAAALPLVGVSAWQALMEKIKRF